MQTSDLSKFESMCREIRWVDGCFRFEPKGIQPEIEARIGRLVELLNLDPKLVNLDHEAAWHLTDIGPTDDSDFEIPNP